MARIPSEEIDRLKREVDLAKLVQSRGVELRKHGADLIGLCPFHDDKEPSFVVSPEKNLWHCLGKCQAGGSVVDWVMKSGGVSFRHAVELLREGVELRGPVVKKGTIPHLPSPLQQEADDQGLLDDVARYYHAALKESPEALAYLETRGLTNSEMIDHFQIGFSNRTLGLRLPDSGRQTGVAMRTRLQRIGILRASGHEHMNGSVTIPIVDENGHTVGMYGRKITPRLRPGTPLHLYLPGPHRGVFNLPALKVSTEIILAESLIDALTFWSAGFRNVTSSYGIEGFSDEIFGAFRKYGTKHVLIAYDRDDAGDAAAAKLTTTLLEAGIECSRILFPKGMDANEYARKVKPAEKSLGLAIRNAQWLGKGKRPEMSTPALEMVAQDLIVTETPPPLTLEPPPPSPAAFSVQTSPTSDVVEAPQSPPPLAAGLASTVSAQNPPAVFDVPVELHGNEVVVKLGERRYRVRGLERNTSLEVLKVNIAVWRSEAFYVDTFDVNLAKLRAHFIKQASAELQVAEDVIKKDLGKLYLILETLQDERIRQALQPQKTVVPMTTEEEAEALAFLRDPRLLENILVDFERCGVVGEEVNKLMGYIAATSRKLERPLAVMVQSSSAAGKSSLMDAVLALMPEEEQERYSAVTGQALYYMGETDLRHKILALAEEEGAERASYALKLLQSEGKLSIASTGKDSATGELKTRNYLVEGPVMIFQTTTAIEMDEELLNRCLVLSVDEGREQTRAIHRIQRRQQTREWQRAREERAHLVKLHQNAQRLLKPVAVHNPYVHLMTFPDDKTRLRRDHGKYLALISAIALLHQHQRPCVTETLADGSERKEIEVTLDDISVANRLAHQVLGRSLDDLPPQTRLFLTTLHRMVTESCAAQHVDQSALRFFRSDVRAYTGWSYTQVKLHLERLVELEYVLMHGGGRGMRMSYELLFDGGGVDGAPYVHGLIDVDSLRKNPATTPNLAGGSRALHGPFTGGSRTQANDKTPRPDAQKSDGALKMNGKPHLGVVSEIASHMQGDVG